VDGGDVGEDMSVVGRTERSVAVYESERIGNVTSEAIELRETCLGCLAKTRDVAAVGGTKVEGAVSRRSARTTLVGR
jgi:hypothetical protein